MGQLTNAYKFRDSVKQKDYMHEYQYDLIGNRTGEWREGFAFASTHNNLNQITNRAWSGTLTVSGYVTNRLNPGKRGVDVGVQTVHVDMQATTRDVRGYVAEGVLVTSAKTQAKENNLITVVNKEQPLPAIGDTTSLDKKSIKWEKIKVEPSTTTPTYDTRGNLTSDGVRTYMWNGHNQLARIQDAGIRSDYAYDGMGRKVRAVDSQYVSGQWTVTSDLWYLYDGWNCVAEIDLQSSSRQVIKSYTWGLDLSGSLSGAGGVGGLLSIQHKWFSKPPHLAALDKPPHPQVTNVIPYLVFCDGNGNIVNLVDMDTGAISAHYEYDPFGRLVCKEGSYADDNEYRFSTKRYNAAWSLYRRDFLMMSRFVG